MAIAPLTGRTRSWTLGRSRAGLEDVFIHLMRDAVEPHGGNAARP